MINNWQEGKEIRTKGKSHKMTIILWDDEEKLFERRILDTKLVSAAQQQPVSIRQIFALFWTRDARKKKNWTNLLSSISILTNFFDQRQILRLATRWTFHRKRRSRCTERGLRGAAIRDAGRRSWNPLIGRSRWSSITTRLWRRPLCQRETPGLWWSIWISRPLRRDGLLRTSTRKPSSRTARARTAWTAIEASATAWRLTIRLRWGWESRAASGGARPSTWWICHRRRRLHCSICARIHRCTRTLATRFRSFRCHATTASAIDRQPSTPPPRFNLSTIPIRSRPTRPPETLSRIAGTATCTARSMTQNEWRLRPNVTPWKATRSAATNSSRPCRRI